MNVIATQISKFKTRTQHVSIGRIWGVWRILAGFCHEPLASKQQAILDTACKQCTLRTKISMRFERAAETEPGNIRRHMRGDFHVRFRGSAGGKFLCATR